jgi:uncharacterized membrane protein YdjX (TVP38/TMEM64 family)
MEKQRRTWKSVFGYALFLLAICLLLYCYPSAYHSFRKALHFFRSKDRLNDFIVSFGFYAPLVFISMQILQIVVAPIPGELTGFIGRYLFGIGPGLVYSTIGLTLGSLFAFLLSRRLGMPFVCRFVGQETMRKFNHLMERQGAFFSFIFFLIPGLPKDYFCYLLGLSPMHIFTFLLISTLGRFPGTLLLTMQGQAVRSENYRGVFLVLGLAFIFFVLTVIYRDRIEDWLKTKKAKQKKSLPFNPRGPD